MVKRREIIVFCDFQILLMASHNLPTGLLRRRFMSTMGSFKFSDFLRSTSIAWTPLIETERPMLFLDSLARSERSMGSVMT